MVECPVTTNISLQDTTDPARVGFAPFNLLEVNVKEYLINPLLGHATAADWSKRYMDFFERNKYVDPASISSLKPFRDKNVRSCNRMFQ